MQEDDHPDSAESGNSVSRRRFVGGAALTAAAAGLPGITGEARHFRVARNVKVRMRDGTRLSASIYFPLRQGRYPVVLVRTAYNRVGYVDPSFPMDSMILMVQDCRGRYEAEGDWHPLVNETQDGYDTVKWIRRSTKPVPPC